MDSPTPGYYLEDDQQIMLRWWDGGRWIDRYWDPMVDHSGFTEFRACFVGLTPDRSVENALFGLSFPSDGAARSVVMYVILPALSRAGFREPRWEVLQFVNDQPVDPHAYRKWLGRKFARIGVASVVGITLGLLLGGD